MNNLRKIFLFLLIFVISFQAVCMADVSIYSPAAVLTDANSGLIIFEKNSSKKMYPASTTKILTAILAIESGKLEENPKLTASFYAVNSIDYDSSKVNLSEGEQMSFEDLLYSLIIASANDAANVLAESVAKTPEAFVELMNKKVKEIGCTNTHFTNPHGLHDENHYTTAEDLAKIASYAMKLPFFSEAVKKTSYTIAPTNKMDEKRYLSSTNHLINKSSKYYYQYATGIKTGYTSHAGYCLVSAAENGGKKLISVVLGAEPDPVETYSFVDSKKLLQYGFENTEIYSPVKENDIISTLPIKSSFSDEAILSASCSVNLLLPKGANPDKIEKKEYIKATVKAPVKKGDKLGRMEYWYGDVKLGQCDMLAVSDYSKIPLAFIFKPIYRLFKSAVFYIVLALILLLMFLYSSFKKQRRRRRRKKTYAR